MVLIPPGRNHVRNIRFQNQEIIDIDIILSFTLTVTQKLLITLYGGEELRLKWGPFYSISIAHQA